MNKPPIPKIEELEGFLGYLELTRLELVESIAANHKSGYDDADLQRLALYGNAIQSVRDAVTFRKKSDNI